jgi:hypothetical protein
MSREEVFSLIQSHLSDELDVDPARIDETTRFKEDLDADSLDLYTLGAGARGLVRRPHVRRGGRADPLRSGRPSTSSSPAAPRAG